jgi:hypothetical protein
MEQLLSELEQSHQNLLKCAKSVKEYYDKMELENNQVLLEEIKKKDRCILKLESEISDLKNTSLISHLTKQLDDLKNQLSIADKVNKNLTKQLQDFRNAPKKIAIKKKTKPESEPEPEQEPEPEPEQEPEQEPEPEPEQEPEPEPEPEPEQEPEPEPESESEPELDDDEDIALTKKKIRGTIYYVTDNEDQYIYEILSNGQVGKIVGQIRKKKAHFYE